MTERITPTGVAEAGYQAKLNAKFDRAMRKGPSGLMIPPARQLYRKTVDGPLLHQITKVAYADYRRRALTREALAGVAALLHEDLLARFPLDDMRVLERYGCAAPRETAIVDIIAGDFERAEHIQLPTPILIRGAAAMFHVDLGGLGDKSSAPVPAETVAYFRDLVRVRRQAGTSFSAAVPWVGIFRTKEGRFPYWSEIERQFPLIGEWMEGQRR